MTYTKHIVLATGLFPPQIGGPATYAKLLADELPQRGWEVTVVNFGDVLHLPRGVRHVVYAYRLFRVVRRTSIIYALDPVSVGVPAWCVAFFTRAPFGVRIAGDYAWEQATQRFGVVDSIDTFQTKKYAGVIWLFRRIQSFIARRARFVVTPSHYFKGIVCGWGVSDKRVHVIYSGIDFSDIRQCERHTNTHTLVSGGRLVPWKGFSRVIEFMHDLPEWRLVVVGDGPDRAKLEHVADAHGVRDRVHFTGALEKGDFMRELCNADVFILNTHYEGLSHILIEVMYAGVPIITTDIGGNPELITHEEDGILFEPDDVVNMKDAVLRLQETPELAKVFVENARKKVGMFSIQRSLDSLEKVIKGI